MAPMSVLFLSLALAAHAEVTVSPAEATCADGDRLSFVVEHDQLGRERRVVSCPSCAAYEDGDVVGLSLFVERPDGNRERAVVPVTVQCPTAPGIPVAPAAGLFLLALGLIAGASYAASQIEPA